MRNKQQYCAVVLCALGIIVAGLTGCSNEQSAGKGKTKEEVKAFAGDPSKMPASYRKRIAEQQAMGQAMGQKAAAEAAEKAQKAAAEAQKAAAPPPPK